MRAEDMRRLRQHLRSRRFLVAFTTMLAVCVATSYAAYALASYFVSTTVDTMVNNSLSSYHNTSPPLATAAGGVTLSLAHSRYLTLDTITATLSNHSSAPIYLPEMGGKTMTGGVTGVLCWESGVERLSAQGWQAVGSGCGWSPPACVGGAAPPIPYPAVGVVAPGQTIILESYEGLYSYPPLSPGAYRFSVAYALTPFQAPHAPWPWIIPGSVTLTTTPVTVTSAWWIPPWYHQHLDCPRMPA